MARQMIRDRLGNILGWIDSRENGFKYAYDYNGRPVGRYDPITDWTRDNIGNPITRGDSVAITIPTHR